MNQYCVPCLGTKARDGGEVTNWFTKTRTYPVRSRINSYEKRFYYFVPKSEVLDTEKNMTKYQALNCKERGVIYR